MVKVVYQSNDGKVFEDKCLAEMHEKAEHVRCGVLDDLMEQRWCSPATAKEVSSNAADVFAILMRYLATYEEN